MIICNVCKEEITEPSEQVDRIYKVIATNKLLPAQKKHDICNDIYSQKTGLIQVE